MEPYTIDPVLTTAFGLLCFVAGAMTVVVMKTLLHRKHRPVMPPVETILPADVERDLRARAHRFAAAKGRPEAEGMVFGLTRSSWLAARRMEK